LYRVSVALGCLLGLPSMAFWGTSGAVSLLADSGSNIPVAALSMIPSWSQAPLDEPSWSPAEVIAMRFPEQWEETPVVRPARPNQVDEADATDHLLFDPYPTFARKRGQFDAAAPPEPAPAKPAPVSVKPTMVAAVHPAGRPDAVFNDAQIATIRQRLKLRPEQQYMWPAVEAALRNL